MDLATQRPALKKDYRGLSNVNVVKSNSWRLVAAVLVTDFVVDVVVVVAAESYSFLRRTIVVVFVSLR